VVVVFLFSSGLSADSVDVGAVSVFAAAEEVLSEERVPPGVDLMGRVWDDGNAVSEDEAFW